MLAPNLARTLRLSLPLVALLLVLAGGLRSVSPWLAPAPRASSGPPALVDAPSRPVDHRALLAELEPAEGELGINIALEDRSGHALDAFSAALERAERGEGTARMVVYGGSHTAGDLMTGRMREVLQARFGDSGHGFVMAYPMIDSAWAWGIAIDEGEGFEVQQVGFKRRGIERYGLVGAAFVSDEPGAFAAVASDHWGNGREASHLEILYDRQPSGGSFEVWLDARRIDVIDTAASAASGARAIYDVNDGPHRVEVRVVGDGPVTLFGVVMERDRPGVLVDNLGLVGSKARHHLLWDEALWRGFFASRNADLVVLAYGNNETTDTHLTIPQHEAQLREVMGRIQSAAPTSSCLLLGPTARPRAREDGALEPRPVVSALTEMQRAVAADFGCAFFDTLAFQGGVRGGLDWLGHDPPYLGADLQHLSREGYLRWGEAVAAAILAKGPRPQSGSDARTP